MREGVEGNSGVSGLLDCLVRGVIQREREKERSESLWESKF